MWVFGYRFNAKIFDIDESVLSNYNYNDYKEKPDGSRSRFAPWELLLIPACAWVLWMLAIHYPATGIKVLTWTAGIAGAVILIYFVTAAWKFPPIVRARAEVSNTWNRVCPPLVVEEAPLFEETAE